MIARPSCLNHPRCCCVMQATLRAVPTSTTADGTSTFAGATCVLGGALSFDDFENDVAVRQSVTADRRTLTRVFEYAAPAESVISQEVIRSCAAPVFAAARRAGDVESPDQPLVRIQLLPHGRLWWHAVGCDGQLHVGQLKHAHVGRIEWMLPTHTQPCTRSELHAYRAAMSSLTGGSLSLAAPPPAVQHRVATSRAADGNVDGTAPTRPSQARQPQHATESPRRRQLRTIRCRRR